MRRLAPILVAVLVLISYGIAEAIWTDRWRISDALERATGKLAQVPLRVGDWEGREQELDSRQVRQAEMSGYLMRRYVNRSTGAEVAILLVCGRAGPTSLHSPDVCYAGAGYAPTLAPERQEVATGANSDTFWVAEFRKPGPAPEPLRIFWAWGTTGEWQASDRPRWQLAHHAALYKLYVIRSLPGNDERAAQDPSLEFMRGFLPVVRRALSAN